MSEHNHDSGTAEETIKRERINLLFRATAPVTEKSLLNFTGSARMDRLKKKQVGLMALMRYFETDLDLCLQEAAKFDKAPFPIYKTLYDIERDTLQTYKQMLDIIWNEDIKESRNISLIVEKMSDATSVFHIFAHTNLETLKTFTMTRDDFVEKCTGHIAEILSSSFNAVSNINIFKTLSLNEIKNIQNSFDYFNRYNAINTVLKNVFHKITADESLMFPLLRKIYHHNDFLKGYIHFQMAVDTQTNEDNATRGKNLKSAVSFFEEAESPILSERTLFYLGMDEQAVRQFAASIGVNTPPFHRQIDLIPRPKGP